jgi:NHLM bacteriocin system ABC transporter peptidase/ATP-binding protein
VESTDVSARSAVPRWPPRVKTPTILQLEAVECGAAALAIVLAYHKRIVPLAEVRRESGVTRDGSQASNMLKAARRYGLIARGFQKDVPDLVSLRPPYIVFWNFNHFVVVEGGRHDRVYLNDPATGPRTVSHEEFDESYTGIVLTFEPGPDFTPGGKAPSTMTALRERLRGSRRGFAYVLVAGVLLVLPSMMVPAFSQIYIDNVLVRQLHDWRRPLVLGLLLTALLRLAVAWLQLRQLRRLKWKLAAVLSSRFMWHLLRLPADFYAQRYSGEISWRLPLNDRVADVLSGRLTTTLIDVAMMSFYVVVMVQYDVPLALVGVGAALLNLLALHWVSRSRVDANLRLMQEHGKAHGVASSGLQSLETLKASALESDFFARWAGHFAKAASAEQALGVTSLRLTVLPMLLASVTAMLVVVLGGLRVLQGSLSIGMLVAFQGLIQSFLAPVNGLVGMGSTIQELQADLNRLDDVLDNPEDPEVIRGDEGTASEGLRLRGAVEFCDVTFGYNRLAPPLIEKLSLKVPPGGRIAIMGASGSGKSTIARLACGLYEPWAGEILFDGVPRSQIPRDVLTESLALIDQETVLFEGTVRENLTLWDPAEWNDDLVAACVDAAVHDVVQSLPGGYDARLIEGGANLSGGQRQRLEIARALVNEPSVVIFDEGTSALDAETERVVIDRLRRRGCSVITIAHRLSAIRDADEIVVLQRGKIVERGTHEALIGVHGEYSRLIATEGQALP